MRDVSVPAPAPRSVPWFAVPPPPLWLFALAAALPSRQSTAAPRDHGRAAGVLSRCPRGLALWAGWIASMGLLLWPAFLNGYPLVFADTGTYLSQAMHRYLGWDRPVFYSLVIFPLHLGIDTWPVVVAQSALAAFVLNLTRRVLRLPAAWLPILTLFLADGTALPWTVSQLMPDLLTPLLIISLSLLVFAPKRLTRPERLTLLALITFMIAAQQSSVPLALGLLPATMALRWILWRKRPPLRPLLAPLAAVAAMILVNGAGHGRLSLSPYGNVFLLARVIYDGPGMMVLRRDCPASGWRLCAFLDRFPAVSDEFLWNSDSPIILAGGHKVIAAEAGEIIAASLRADPAGMLRAATRNFVAQLMAFETGDGLEPWPAQVGRWIDTDFPPAERARFGAATQQRGEPVVTPDLQVLHRVVAVLGIAAALGLIPLAWRRRPEAVPFLIVALLALPMGAAITGTLSGSHHRYQSRIVWLPACFAFLTAASLMRPRARTDWPAARNKQGRWPNAATE